MDIGKIIKEKRKEKGISLNRMSHDLYGSRMRVNHLSKIEKGIVDPRLSGLIKIAKYLDIEFIFR